MLVVLIKSVVVLVDLRKVGSLVLIPISNVARAGLNRHLPFCLFFLPKQLLLINLLTLHLGQDFALHIFLSHAGLCVLCSGLIIALNDLLLSREFVMAHHGGLLLFLFNNRFGVVGKLLALVLDLLDLVPLQVSLLVEGAQHVTTLVVLLHALDLFRVLLLGDSFLELVGVVLLVKRLLNLLLGLLPLVRLHAVLLDGSPLVHVAPLVRRVVPFVVLVQSLDLLHFVLQRLFHSVR